MVSHPRRKLVRRGGALATELVAALCLIGACVSGAWAQGANADVGDAPDSHNLAGAVMTAYPPGGQTPVVASFPTTFASRLASGLLPGPRHLNETLYFFLGPQISGELDAEPPAPDADGMNNLLPTSDTADLDVFDDGVSISPIPNCQLALVTFSVNVPGGLPPSLAHVNMWFDWNRNGTWGDVLDCGPGDRSRSTRWRTCR
jgi:hypothetical protein